MSEVRDTRPRILAKDTWQLLYPEREEGPEKAAAPIHQRPTFNAHALRQVHATRLRPRGPSCPAAENGDLEFLPHLHPQPDLMVYLRDPGLGREADGPSRFTMAAHGPPDWVLDVLSPQTWARDIGHRVKAAANKTLTYAALGIRGS